MKLIILAVLAIIIAGHFIPVKSNTYKWGACGEPHTQKTDYRYVLGQYNDFLGHEDQIKNRVNVELCIQNATITHKNKLYLW